MKNKKVQLLLTLVVVVAIIGGAAALIANKRSKVAKAPRYGLAPTPVHVAVATRGDLEKRLSYLAVVEPYQKANVASRIAATVTAVRVDEGRRVKKGGVLARLDSKDIQEDIAAMSAQIEQAKADLRANNATLGALEKSAVYWQREAQRDGVLARDGAIAESQAEASANKADEIRGQRDATRQKATAVLQIIKSLERKKARLEAQLPYYTLRSPFDGVVTHRLVDPGDLAVPGKVLIIVEDRSRLILAFDVPQQDLQGVREGLPVRYDAGGKGFEAKLSHLYPALDASRMARAEVYLDGVDTTGLTIGSYMPVTVQVAQMKGVTLVPAACLIASSDTSPYVYIVSNKHIAIRPVKVLGRDGRRVAIDGVKPGEAAVMNTFLGWAQLAEGMPVEVVE
ncbi:MAG: efflux RND transporter periplasmic adaptor subunit [Deltaproteobacteria bacterium]|nr:efflux RND transporter periplasmic adaptor subunit [Deltaproteobacteria bacterium]